MAGEGGAFRSPSSLPQGPSETSRSSSLPHILLALKVLLGPGSFRQQQTNTAPHLSQKMVPFVLSCSPISSFTHSLAGFQSVICNAVLHKLPWADSPGEADGEADWRQVAEGLLLGGRGCPAAAGKEPLLRLGESSQAAPLQSSRVAGSKLPLAEGRGLP